MTFVRLALALLLTTALAAAPLAASPLYDEIVVFGDSLSDTGFFSSVTEGAVPGPGYTDGRFSNGPVWIEHVAQDLGHATPLPPTLGGTNYAFGAGRTHTSLAPEDEAGLVHMDQQVDMYLDHLSQPTTPTAEQNLFVLWGGANDFMRADPTNPPDPATSAQNIGNYIQQLYDAGGRHFLVGDLPSLGEVPATRDDPDARAGLNLMASMFNAALAQVLTELEAQPDINLVRLPAADIFDAAWAGEHSFANVTDPAVPGLEPGATTWGEPVSNPDAYMFWDAVHPSAEMHQIIANEALTLIPEPTSIALIAGPALLLLSRRKRLAA